MFKLQSTRVPVPRVMRNSSPSRRKYPFDDMDVGDWFFVDGPSKSTFNTYVYTVGRELGVKFSTRRTFMAKDNDNWVPCEPDDPKAVPGVWVGRVE